MLALRLGQAASAAPVEASAAPAAAPAAPAAAALSASSLGPLRPNDVYRGAWRFSGIGSPGKRVPMHVNVALKSRVLW